jgi:hypothetical protein
MSESELLRSLAFAVMNYDDKTKKNGRCAEAPMWVVLETA